MTLKQFTIQNKLLRLLKKNPRLAELTHEHEMLFEYWHQYDMFCYDQGVFFIPRSDMNELTSFQSISRARRKLIEDGKIKVSEESQIKSCELEKEYTLYYGGCA